MTKVKPQIDLAAPLSKTLFARAAFDMAVKVRLVSTTNGATLWTDSAVRQGTVGSVGMDDGVPVFSVRDKRRGLGRPAPADHVPADLGLPPDPPAHYEQRRAQLDFAGGSAVRS